MIHAARAAVTGLTIAIPLTLAGCADEPPAAASPWSLGTSGLPRATLVEELRLDAQAEDFSAVSFIYVGPDGRMAIPLRQDRQIRIYDAAGERIGAVGREGEGPGEFSFVGRVGFIGDTLWANDRQLGRVTFFAPDGAVLRTWSPEEVLLDPPDGAWGAPGHAAAVPQPRCGARRRLYAGHRPVLVP